MKKPIASYEDMLDAKAKTTYEKDLKTEATEILNFFKEKHESGMYSIIKVLVGKNLISLKDVQRILGD